MSSSPEEPIVLRDDASGLEVHIVLAGACLQRLLVPVKSADADADADDADANADAANAADATAAAATPPKKEAKRRDVVLGHASPADYLSVDPTCYLGAVVGRLANRVAGARFAIGGREYPLAANNGPNSLHGGRRGLDRRRWALVPGAAAAAATAAPATKTAATLRYVSPAGEEGYPGALEVEAAYSLPPGRRALRLEMRARCLVSPGGDGGDDKPDADADAAAASSFALPAEGTPVALAAHSYFNLAGCDVAPSVLAVGAQGDDAAAPAPAAAAAAAAATGAAAAAAAAGAAAAATGAAAPAAPPPHFLHMPRASLFTPLDANQIPTGALEPVAGTPFDFASGPRALGERAAQVPGVDRPGYDHNFVFADAAEGGGAGGGAGGGRAERALALASAPGGLLPLPPNEAAQLPLAASLECAGLRMEVRTNAPGVQLYTGNYLGGEDGEGDAAAPKAKDGAAPCRRWAGVAIETQNWPDAVNRPGKFPSPLLRAGEEYVHVVEYSFSDV